MNNEKMIAAVYNQYGPPEVVEIKEVARPVPKSNEVLIAVHASTVNRTDCGFRSANYFVTRFFSGLLRPRKPILGNEFAGIVEAVGKDVDHFRPGDKVFGYDDAKFGGHAEYKTIAENKALVVMPADTTFDQAAPITEGAHYALCNIRAANIARGQQILINGATGAIGSSALQIMKYMGAEITAVCAGDKADLVRSLGASEVIDYTKEDFTAIDRKFDVVFDAVGKSTFGKCKPLLKKGGIYMSTELGPRSQNPLLALTTPLLGGKKVLFPLPTINQQDVVFLKELVEEGHFQPVIDRHYPLEQIVEAYRYVETGQKIGNVIIDIAPTPKSD